MVLDKSFLIDYIQTLYNKPNRYSSLEVDGDLNIIWNVKKIEPVLRKALDLISERELFIGITEHFGNSFFKNLEGNNLDLAKQFLISYCDASYKDINKMNLIVDIAKNSMHDFYKEVVLHYITLTQDKEAFANIQWTSESGCYWGDVIMGDIINTKWKMVLSILESSNLGIKVIPIKEYINNQIAKNEQLARDERKQRFLINNHN